MDADLIRLLTFARRTGEGLAKQALLEAGQLATRERLSRLANPLNTLYTQEDDSWTADSHFPSSATITGPMQDLQKQALLDNNQLVTRELLAKKMPRKRWRLIDWDEDRQAAGQTADRTALNPAFD